MTALPVVPITSGGSKQARVDAGTPVFKAMRVYLPPVERTPPVRCDTCRGLIVETVEFVPSEGHVEEHTCINCGRAPLQERHALRQIAPSVVESDTRAFAGKQRRRQPAAAPSGRIA